MCDDIQFTDGTGTGRPATDRSIVFTLLIFSYKRKKNFCEVFILSPRKCIDDFWFKFPHGLSVSKDRSGSGNNLRPALSLIQFAQICFLFLIFRRSGSSIKFVYYH